MGLKEAFQNAAQAAMNAFGNVVASAIYESAGTSTYDTTQGKVISQNKKYAIKAVVESYSEDDIKDNPDLERQKRVLIAANSIIFTPTIDDAIYYENKRWNVSHVEKDPADALWTLRITLP